MAATRSWSYLALSTRFLVGVMTVMVFLGIVVTFMGLTSLDFLTVFQPEKYVTIRIKQDVIHCFQE